MPHYASITKPVIVLVETIVTDGTHTNANFGNADYANSTIAATSFTTTEHQLQTPMTRSKYHTTQRPTHKHNHQTLTTYHRHHDRITKDLEHKATTDAAKKDAAEKHAAAKSKRKPLVLEMLITMETTSSAEHPRTSQLHLQF